MLQSLFSLCERPIDRLESNHTPRFRTGDCGAMTECPTVMPSIVMDKVAGTALDLFVHHGPPWMGKKAVEMGRYYGSEALRNPKLQKKKLSITLLNAVLKPLTNYQQRLDQKKIIKQTGKILMEMLWMFTN